MESKRRSSSLRAAQKLAGKKNTIPLDLAKALYEARQVSEERMGQILAATGLKRRKAYYLVAVWKRFADLHIPTEELAAVGWTKLRIIAEHAAPGEEKRALELAMATTANDLPGVLRRDDKAGAGRGKTHSILLRLENDQYEVFESVLKSFGAAPPTKGRGLVGKEDALIKALRSIPSSA